MSLYLKRHCCILMKTNMTKLQDIIPMHKSEREFDLSLMALYLHGWGLYDRLRKSSALSSSHGLTFDISLVVDTERTPAI